MTEIFHSAVYENKIGTRNLCTTLFWDEVMGIGIACFSYEINRMERGENGQQIDRCGEWLLGSSVNSSFRTYLSNLHFHKDSK